MSWTVEQHNKWEAIGWLLDVYFYIGFAISVLFLQPDKPHWLAKNKSE